MLMHGLLLKNKYCTWYQCIFYCYNWKQAQTRTNKNITISWPFHKNLQHSSIKQAATKYKNYI